MPLTPAQLAHLAQLVAVVRAGGGNHFRLRQRLGYADTTSADNRTIRFIELADLRAFEAAGVARVRYDVGIGGGAEFALLLAATRAVEGVDPGRVPRPGNRMRE